VVFLSTNQLRQQLRAVFKDKEEQGHEVRGLADELARVPDSYDQLYAFAHKLAYLPMRPDWQYVEPNDLHEIFAECDPSRPLGRVGALDSVAAGKRIEAAFLGSVCGCILGKPLEIDATFEEIRRALCQIDDWPLRDYISERIAGAFDRPLHRSWQECVRGRIKWVAPDDDLNYTILGMLLLEQHGLGMTKVDICRAWLEYLPPLWTWGPERMILAKATLQRLDFHSTHQNDQVFDHWVTLLNPGDEFCGAMIRADAYGYACTGRPALAAELAWRDASFTHRRTGIYGTMFAAAAIAVAPVSGDPLAIFETALKFVPRRSRFYAIVSDSLDQVACASDWLDGYSRIHRKYQQYASCQVFQETGTLINSLRFAENVGDGICKQVSQGNDTDSYGATVGSILGAYFGPGHLEDKWLAPFNDEIHTKLAGFYEQSLSAVAQRMGALPQVLAAELVARPKT
jgi:ADP-ribosylglycohydrolase